MPRMIVSALVLLMAPSLALAEEARAVPPPGPTTDPTQVRSGSYVLDPAHGKITWSVSHLGFSTYYGAITGVQASATLDAAEPGRSTLTATIPMAGIDGQDSRLNEHLRGPDFFDAATYPSATFTALSVEPTSSTTARVNGTLSLHGVTKPLSFDATFNQAGINPVDRRYTVGFDGRAVLRRSDFGVNAYLPLVGDEVTLRLEGEFKAVE